MDEVTVMLLVSNLTISTENQNNSTEFATTRKQKINGKLNQLVFCSQRCPGNEVILSEDADNLLDWDWSVFF